MSEEVVGVENHRLDSGVVQSAIGEDGKILILIPGVANNETGGKVISAVKILGERRSWHVAVNDLAEKMRCGSPEQKSSCFLKLHNDEPLTKRNSCTGEGIGEIAVKPEQKLLPDLPLGLNLLRGLETVENLSSVSQTIRNWN